MKNSKKIIVSDLIIYFLLALKLINLQMKDSKNTSSNSVNLRDNTLEQNNLQNWWTRTISWARWKRPSSIRMCVIQQTGRLQCASLELDGAVNNCVIVDNNCVIVDNNRSRGDDDCLRVYLVPFSESPNHQNLRTLQTMYPFGKNLKSTLYFSKSLPVLSAANQKFQFDFAGPIVNEKKNQKILTP